MPGLQEELVHLDVGRQPVRAHRLGVGEVGPGAEQAVEQRRDEAALEVALVTRTDERQPGENLSLIAGISASRRAR